MNRTSAYRSSFVYVFPLLGFVAISFIFCLFPQKVLAQEAAVLFYSKDCPHCQNVEKQLTDKGYRSMFSLTEKEVTTSQANLDEYYADIKICQFPSDQAGVPMIFFGGHCYMGELDVMNEVVRLAGVTGDSPFIQAEGKTGSPSPVVQGKSAVQGETVALQTDNATDNSPGILPVVSSGVPLETAKRNTLLFIGLMSLVLMGLVGVGYWKKGSEGSKSATGKKSLKIIIGLAGILIALNYLALSQPLVVRAFCPVCTLAVGAGLGVSKYLGIDDVISGLWVGGLTISMTMWLINWLTSKKIKFFGRKPLIVVAMYALVLWPLSLARIVGIPGNTLWGWDKIVLGTAIGSVGFLAGYLVNFFLVKKHQGEVYFPFQKVVLPLVTLIVLSLVFYFIVY